jgi:acyl carrier protein
MDPSMDRDELIKVIQEVAFRILAIEPAEVCEETNFRDNLAVDSLEFMDFMASLEKRLKISLGEQDFDDVQTVGEVLDLLTGTAKGG